MRKIFYEIIGFFIPIIILFIIFYLTLKQPWYLILGSLVIGVVSGFLLSKWFELILKKKYEAETKEKE
jgi:asparagine N-glycosylation enzyme membrane subunit Stt3